MHERVKHNKAGLHIVTMACTNTEETQRKITNSLKKTVFLLILIKTLTATC